MPSFLLYYAITQNSIDATKVILGVAFLIYIISGLRRLIEFNIKVEVGEAEKYFTGVPTPLGAILLWILYLLYSYNIISNPYIITILVLFIAWSLIATKGLDTHRKESSMTKTLQKYLNL